LRLIWFISRSNPPPFDPPTHPHTPTTTLTHPSIHPTPRRALDLMRTATHKPDRPRQLSQEEERALPVQERLYR